MVWASEAVACLFDIYISSFRYHLSGSESYVKLLGNILLKHGPHLGIKCRERIVDHPLPRKFNPTKQERPESKHYTIPRSGNSPFSAHQSRYKVLDEWKIDWWKPTTCVECLLRLWTYEWLAPGAGGFWEPFRRTTACVPRCSRDFHVSEYI